VTRSVNSRPSSQYPQVKVPDSASAAQDPYRNTRP
jgi:hypothetical protein